MRKLFVAPLPVEDAKWSALSEVEMRKAALAAFRQIRMLEVHSQRSELRAGLTKLRRELADFIVDFLPELVQNYEISLTLES